jgi:DNA (cytosine-5)-methyltransferase 1
MDYSVFCQWLKSDKKMTERSARDVVSRCKRIQKITEVDTLDECTETTLIECEDFDKCSMFIKSQLKRALSLYSEYMRGNEPYGR